MSDQVRINGRRLWQRLNAMAEIGATALGGCNRQALTDEDKLGRDLFLSWCTAAGCSIRIDEVGNMFARRAGRNDGLPPVMTGSHLDTQPTGGKYDGVYGVLAGLEVVETLNDHGVETEHAIEVVVWTNEEGARFDMAMMGSAVWAGLLPLEDAYQLADREGVTLGSELNRLGLMGRQPATYHAVKAVFEAHIEQGPVLEAGDQVIGVVTGVQNMSRYRVVIGGVEVHAGPTPMEMRRDPVMGLAAILTDLYEMTATHEPEGRLTVGCLSASPGSSNTVPGRVEFTVDIRHPDEHCYAAMLSAFQSIVRDNCACFELDVSIDRFFNSPGVTFDPGCIQAVSDAVEVLGYASRRMVSGAGHDACNLAGVAPTSMIFIPCAGGISHNELESISAEHADAGANVLLLSVLSVAS
jgi:N-carbamoyl-L-amino-acid hydrolase